MKQSLRAAAHWVGRHAFPAIAATVVAVGAVGGGIGYAVASQHSTSAPVASAAATPTPGATKRAGSGASRGAQLLQRMLSLVAAQTGQSVTSVRSQLQSGTSIDAIAGAKAPAVESAFLDQVNKLAQKAVSAGKITAAQEAAALAMAKTQVEALMAEPGTQLLADAQRFLQLLPRGGARHGGAAAPSPSAAA